MDEQVPPPQGDEGTASTSEDTSTSNKAAEGFAECRWSSRASTSTHATRMGRLQANVDLIDKTGRHWFLLDLEYRRRLREAS